MTKHFTVTIYLVAKLQGKIKVFLHWHKKINGWLGVGGHLEENESPIETLNRECQEEIGQVPILFNSTRLVHDQGVDELIPPNLMFEFNVPKYKNKPQHKHIDLIYFGTVTKPFAVKLEEKYGWFSKNELKNLDLDPEKTYITHEALAQSKKYL